MVIVSTCYEQESLGSKHEEGLPGPVWFVAIPVDGCPGCLHYWDHHA